MRMSINCIFFDISKICKSLPNKFSFKISVLQNATLKDKKNETKPTIIIQ